MPKFKDTICSILILCATATMSAADTKGVVTASTLKVRAAAALDGKVLATLPRGAEVIILGENKNMIVVDEIEDSWLQIKSGDIQGWVFGGFVSQHYQFVHGSKNKIAWATNQLPKGHSTKREVVLYDADSKKLRRIAVDWESSDFTFSANLKYLAVNGGTYVFGTIYIHSVEDGKLIHSSGFYPRAISWKGDTLEFNNILCDGENEQGGSAVLWEEVKFADGKISRSGKYGEEGGIRPETASCAPYKKILKKFR